MSRCGLVGALFIAAACTGCASPGTQADAAVPRTARCTAGETPSINDLLYFGRAQPHGTVTQDEWAAFLGDVVTPLFPAGLSTWPASGQWRDRSGLVTHEPSFVLDLVHPDDERSENSVRAIMASYKSRFQQEAVLRVRSEACISF